MKMTSFTRGFTTNVKYNGCCKRSYHIELWTQPWRHWLIARIYHWYDMRICKVPGFKFLERTLERRAKRKYGSQWWLYLPLSVRQDLRCYDLREKQRVTLATIEVDKETYTSIRDKMPG